MNIMNTWRMTAAVAALAMFVVIAAVMLAEDGGGADDGVTRYQGGGVNLGSNSPPPFDATEDDFIRLRIRPFLAEITSTITYCVVAGGPIDLTSGPGLAAVNAAFATWDTELGLNLFQPAGTIIDCGGAAGVVQWGSLGSRAVGQAGLQFGAANFATRTAPVTGFTITLNSDFSWAIGAQANMYDVQSVLTHEAGHPLGLDDLKPIKDLCLTMFGSAFLNDIRERTLGHGDKLGAHAIYGGVATGTAASCTA